MKRLLAATTLVIFGLTPAIGGACEYMDEAAATQPPAQIASTPPPAASKLPQAKATPTLAPKAQKQDVAKTRAPAPEQKVAAVNNN